MNEASEPRVSLLTWFSAVDASAARGVEDELRRMAQGVPDEPGHLFYEVYADEAAATLYVVETWATSEDARRHQERVETTEAVGRVAPLLQKAPRTLTLRPVVPRVGEQA